MHPVRRAAARVAGTWRADIPFGTGCAPLEFELEQRVQVLRVSDAARGQRESDWTARRIRVAESAFE